MRAAYLAFQTALPEAELPDTTILIGRGNSGGTAKPSGVLIGLEGMRYDATALCRRLHIRRQRTGESYEIVGLGGGQDGPAVLAALNAGADDVVPRSDDRDMLLVRIRGTLRRKLAVLAAYPRP